MHDGVIDSGTDLIAVQLGGVIDSSGDLIVVWLGGVIDSSTDLMTWRVHGVSDSRADGYDREWRRKFVKYFWRWEVWSVRDSADEVGLRWIRVHFVDLDALFWMVAFLGR
jgi:hypothetical protein